jgi:site-specific recombinase XerC
MTSPTLVGPLLQFFFTDYLIAQRRVSPQTIASYRDTFRLLLQFVDHETGIGPTALRVASLDPGSFSAFSMASKRTVATASSRATCA